MNTVGKILVVLNFLLAIIAGVLVVFSVALRTPWKEAYLAKEREVQVLKAQRETNANIMIKILSDNKQGQLDIEQLKQTLKETEEQIKGIEASYTAKIDELNNKVKDSDISLQETVKAKERLIQEITFLNTSIKDREGSIIKLEGDVKKYRIEAVNYEQLAKARQTQNELLLEQVQDYSRKIARAEAGVNPDVMVIRDPNSPNPPTVQVNGKIELVDAKDTTLVQISLGTDHGVTKNHTLDVYRTRPKAEYLGMIRIVESYNHKSVARLVPAGNPAFRPQLRPDDLVTSRITK